MKVVDVKKRLLIAAPMALAMTLVPLPIADAQESSVVVINEVESNGDAIGDWIELANTDRVNSVDISGWSFVDNDPTHEPYVFPAEPSLNPVAISPSTPRRPVNSDSGEMTLSPSLMPRAPSSTSPSGTDMRKPPGGAFLT